MIRRFIGVIGGAAVIVLVAIAIGLGLLAYNQGRFADYWQGRANQPGDFIYVVIGDSTAQGLGASRPENGYVSLLAGKIGQATGRQVRVLNLSTAGATVEDAVRRQAPRLQELKADLVTVGIGADAMRNYDAARFSRNYELLLQALPPGKALVLNVPYFGYRGYWPPQAADHALVANQAIDRLAYRYHVPVTDLYSYLQDRQSPWIYASDFSRPNDRGYRLWYQALWPAVEKQLQQRDGLAETPRL